MYETELISTLQNLDTDQSYTFQREEIIKDFQSHEDSSDLIIRKGTRMMGFAGDSELPFETFQVLNRVEFYAYKETFVKLGIWMIQLFFTQEEYLQLDLKLPNSQIKQLFFYAPISYENDIDYYLKVEKNAVYKSFEYVYRKLDKFPFSEGMSSGPVPENINLPYFDLACSDYQQNHKIDRIKNADQLIVNTSSTGLLELASLFIRMGNIHNEQDEICLENPTYGFGGTTDYSLEARFWLPGSFDFDTEKIEDLYT